MCEREVCLEGCVTARAGGYMSHTEITRKSHCGPPRESRPQPCRRRNSHPLVRDRTRKNITIIDNIRLNVSGQYRSFLRWYQVPVRRC